jgi:hypothetical protein
MCAAAREKERERNVSISMTENEKSFLSVQEKNFPPTIIMVDAEKGGREELLKEREATERKVFNQCI